MPIDMLLGWVRLFLPSDFRETGFRNTLSIVIKTQIKNNKKKKNYIFLTKCNVPIKMFFHCTILQCIGYTYDCLIFLAEEKYLVACYFNNIIELFYIIYIPLS